MTYEEQLQYYADLLIIQYRGQARAQATIQAVARQALVDNIPITIENAFDLDTAIGVQLDTLGLYVGVTRQALTFTGGVNLDDDDFRQLIRMAIATNTCKGSLQDIETLLSNFFGNAIQVFDNADMTLSYFFNASIGSLALLEAFVVEGFLPKPLGVGLASLIYAVGLDNYFAFSSAYRAWPTGVSGFRSAYDVGTLYFTGNTTNGSKVITSIPDTSILTEGDPISGAGIATSSFIDTIDSPTQIHITVNATATATGADLVSQSLAPWINIDDIISF